jgi:hypothetical protein
MQGFAFAQHGRGTVVVVDVWKYTVVDNSLFKAHSSDTTLLAIHLPLS